MSAIKKKQSRQRNRPRNKSNRNNDNTVNCNYNDNIDDEMNTSTSTNIEDNSVVQEIQCVTNEKSSQLVAAMLALTTQSNRPATQTVYDSNDAIKIIQKIMRAKLLQQSQRQNNNDNNNNNNNKNDTDNNAPNDDIQNVKLIKSNTNELVESNSKIQSKLKDNIVQQHTNTVEKHNFMINLQRKMENAIANDNNDLPNALLDNLQKLLQQPPVSDVETSDDDDETEYIEYVYKPRQYFVASLCNYCKIDLMKCEMMPCNRCGMTYYCTQQHMKNDQQHQQLCYALRQVADSCGGGHIFHKCGVFSAEQFRSYRIVTMHKIEAIINRSLTPAEKEVILFPRLCNEGKCREYRFKKLLDCEKCGQVAFCSDKLEHLSKSHNSWCKAYKLFKELIIFQEKFGRLDPSLPSKVLKHLPVMCSNTKEIFTKLAFDIKDNCEYAALSQISTGPLTAWYALKLCNHLKKDEHLTIHLIGAEIEFEVNVLHKWELLFLHLTPSLKQLSIVFIGPELNPNNISFEALQKTKCCRSCRQCDRKVNYYFENLVYHDYCKTDKFIQPDLVCFFNAGLYRSTGFQMEDTWPETILAAASYKCPIVVTSYTEYEAPLDMTSIVQECNRRLNVILPPTQNPFASEKPERNFISDDNAPLIFKNYYCFVVE